MGFSGFLKNVGTLIKLFRQFMSQKCFIEFPSIPTLNLLWKWSYYRFLLYSSMTRFYRSSWLKSRFLWWLYEQLKNHFLFLKLMLAQIIFAIYIAKVSDATVISQAFSETSLSCIWGCNSWPSNQDIFWLPIDVPTSL